jgi:hypothetical protein
MITNKTFRAFAIAKKGRASLSLMSDLEPSTIDLDFYGSQKAESTESAQQILKQRYKHISCVNPPTPCFQAIDVAKRTSERTYRYQTGVSNRHLQTPEQYIFRSVLHACCCLHSCVSVIALMELPEFVTFVLLLILIFWLYSTISHFPTRPFQQNSASYPAPGALTRPNH